MRILAQMHPRTPLQFRSSFAENFTLLVSFNLPPFPVFKSSIFSLPSPTSISPPPFSRNPLMAFPSFKKSDVLAPMDSHTRLEKQHQVFQILLDYGVSKRDDEMQSLEKLACIPDFIPKHIFPKLSSSDQFQLASSSYTLLENLHQHLAPKIICKTCQHTLIATTYLPPYVQAFNNSEGHYNTLVQVFCENASKNHLRGPQMEWTHDKFAIGDTPVRGKTALQCKHCNTWVAVLIVTPLKLPMSFRADEVHSKTGKDFVLLRWRQVIFTLRSSTATIFE